MIELRVNDMSCSHCVGTITKAVKAVDANARVEADLETKRVRIESTQPVAELTRVIGDAGYPATAI